jgi:hypothetical protein
MPGERDLAPLLRGLSPALDDIQYGFGTLPRGQALPDGVRWLGLFEEDEGVTVIAPRETLAAAGIVHSAAMAKISLKVHSSLEAVGLTAAISAALTDVGISANVVAAYFHDHVFVPWNRRDEALIVLRALSVGKPPR